MGAFPATVHSVFSGPARRSAPFGPSTFPQEENDLKKFARAVTTAAAVIVMAISGLAMTSTAAAAGEVGALGCTATGADKDATAYNKAFTTTVNIRSGRSTNCVSLGVGYTSHTVDIHCTSEYNGVHWTYLRNATTGVKGWVKTSLLDWPNHRLVIC